MAKLTKEEFSDKLFKNPNFKKEVNKHALKPYLTFQYSVLDETFFKGVFKLKPGHFMVYKDGKIKIEQYWDVEFNQENIDLQESINRIKDAVSESVEVHSHSEVPLGSFLSGGVDSSYIAKCLMPQKTFSVGFEQENFDESDLAKDLSDILGIENVRKMITADECFDMLPTIQYHMDEPQSNPSSVPLYFLAQLAREHVTVVLSGEGADEIFGGYEWYDDDEKLKKYKKLPSFIRKPVAKVAEKMPYFKGRTTLIRGGSSVEDYFIGQAQIFEEREAVDILQSPYTKSPSIKEITRPVYNNVKNEDDVTKKQYHFKNIITYQVKNTTLNDGENKGRQNIENVGSGTGYYISGGYSVPIKWEKQSRKSQTKYYYMNGEELKVNDGNTFIQIEPVGQKLSIS